MRMESAHSLSGALTAGRFEEVLGQFAKGWVTRPEPPPRGVAVEIVEGPRVVATGHAVLPKRRRRGGPPRLEFLIRLPLWLYDGAPHILHAREAGSETPLEGEQVLGGVDFARGQLEGVSDNVLFGWIARDPGDKAAPVVEVRVGSAMVGQVRARLRRPDIEKQGLAEAAAGFLFDLSPHVDPEADAIVSVIDTKTGRAIAGTPFRLDGQRAWGVLDDFTGIEASGWAVSTRPAGPVRLEVLVNGTLEKTVLADRPRPDLKKIGVANLRCGFHFSLPARYFDGYPTTLAVRVAGTARPLRGSVHRFRVRLRHAIEKVSGRSVSGWILDPARPGRPVRMDLWVDGRKRRAVVANRPGPLAKTAEGAPRRLQAAFTANLPALKRRWKSLQVRFTAPDERDPLTGKDLHLVRGRDGRVTFREVRPAVERDLAIPVDVVLFAERADDAVLRCARGILNTRDPLAFQLLLVSDAIEDVRFLGAVRQLADHAGLTLLQNPVKSGFRASVNAAMLLHRGRDVVLIEPSWSAPSGAWLTRLRDAAYAKPRTATAQPRGAGNACTYIRREALDEVDGLGAEAGMEAQLTAFLASCVAQGWKHSVA